MTRSHLPISLLALAAATGAPALGQSIRNHNSNAPVDIDADRFEVQDRADRAVASGNVHVKQGALALDAARLTVAYASGGNGVAIQRLDASGGVTVRSNAETARGDFAIYDLNRRIITLVGGVVLTQGANVVRGGRLVMDLATGRSLLDGGGSQGSAGGGGGRVSGRFTVPQRGQ